MWRQAMRAAALVGTAIASPMAVVSANTTKLPPVPKECQLQPVPAAAAAGAPASNTKPVHPDLTFGGECSSCFELVQVQVIMRHGARSTCGPMSWETAESFGKDWQRCHTPAQALEDPAMGECLPGQLTVNGEEMCVELGRRLRRRYGDELGLVGLVPDYQRMHIESTTYQRARLSLKRVMEGLFPSAPPSQAYLDAQIDADEAIQPKMNHCAALLKEYHRNQARAVTELRSAPLFLEMRDKINAAALAAGAIKEGEDVLAKQSWVALGDWGHSRAFHGLPLFPGLPADFLPVTEQAAWHQFRMTMAATPQAVRWGLGPLVDRIMGFVDYAASGAPPPGMTVRTNVDIYAPKHTATAVGGGGISDTSGAGAAATGATVSNDPHTPLPGFELFPAQPPKLVVFSGHDTTLTPLAAALGVPLLSWPPFSSHFEIELWRDKRMPAVTSADYSYNRLEAIVRHQRGTGAGAAAGGEFPHTEPMPAGKHWPHVTAAGADATPASVTDAHWVRLIFNGTVVGVLPLGRFKETLAYYRTDGIDTRTAECGPWDPTVPRFRW